MTQEGQEHGEAGSKSKSTADSGQAQSACHAQFLCLWCSHCYDPQSVVMHETYRAIVVTLHSLPALVLSLPIL